MFPVIIRQPSSHLYPAISLQFTYFFLEHNTYFGSFWLQYIFNNASLKCILYKNTKASEVTWQLKPVCTDLYIPLLSIGSVPVCTIHTTFLYLVPIVDFLCFSYFCFNSVFFFQDIIRLLTCFRMHRLDWSHDWTLMHHKTRGMSLLQKDR